MTQLFHEKATDVKLKLVFGLWPIVASLLQSSKCKGNIQAPPSCAECLGRKFKNKQKEQVKLISTFQLQSRNIWLENAVTTHKSEAKVNKET